MIFFLSRIFLEVFLATLHIQAQIYQPIKNHVTQIHMMLRVFDVF